MSSLAASPQRDPSASTYRPVALSPSPSPPTCLVRNVSDQEAHVHVENTFDSLRADIEKRMSLYNKGMQIRTRRWLEKLQGVATSNLTWLKNRNNYTRLLLEQLRKGRLEKPFDVAPSPGPLPTLPRYLTYSYMPDKRSSRSPSPLKSRGRPSTSPPDIRPALAPVGAQDVTLSPGPASSRGQTAMGLNPSAEPTYGANTPQRDPFGSMFPRQSPEPGIPATRYSSLSSAEKEDLLVKLDYQLTVSRERQLDLERQLAAANAKIEEQTSEIAAIRYQTQQQRQQQTTPQSTGSDCKRKSARAELDRMISRVQSTRQAWDSPVAASDKSTPRRSPRVHTDHPADVVSDVGLPSSIRSKLASGRFENDDDFLRHLEEFQRRTDVLQGQITRMHSSPMQ